MPALWLPVKLPNTLLRTFITGPVTVPISKQVLWVRMPAGASRRLLKSMLCVAPAPPPASWA